MKFRRLPKELSFVPIMSIWRSAVELIIDTDLMRSIRTLMYKICERMITSIVLMISLVVIVPMVLKELRYVYKYCTYGLTKEEQKRVDEYINEIQKIS